MHYLWLGFNETLACIISKWNLIAVSRGHLQSHLCLFAKSESEETTAGKVRRGLSWAPERAWIHSLQQMLYLCLLSGLGMTFHLLCFALVWLFGTSRCRSEQRARPSATVKRTWFDPPFASKHHPAEVSLNKFVDPVQLQGHRKVSGEWPIAFLYKNFPETTN